MPVKMAEEVEPDLGLAEIEAEELIHRKMEMSLAYYEQHPEEIDVRLDELDQEWDLNRLAQVCGAGLSIGGVGMGFLFGRKWFLLPGIVGWLMLQFGLRREVPPVPFLRKLGIRTSGEIDQERSGLLALRDSDRSDEGDREDEREGGGDAAASGKKKSRKRMDQQSGFQGGAAAEG